MARNIILALFIATVRAAFLKSLGQGKGTPLFMSQNRKEAMLPQVQANYALSPTLRKRIICWR